MDRRAESRSTSRTRTRSATACASRRPPRQAGFEAVWQAESRLVREATIPLAAFGAATERIKLGSGVVSMWVRNPAFLAATFSTLDDLAPGRVILGIGAWWDPLAAKVGVSRPTAARDARDRHGGARAARGRDRHVRRRVRPPRRRRARLRAPGAPAQRTFPIVIGATGMQMMRLAGEIADGALLNYLVSPAYNTTAVAALAEGAAKAGRQRRRHRPAAARRVLDGRRP